jgi:hypothetical protein
VISNPTNPRTRSEPVGEPADSGHLLELNFRIDLLIDLHLLERHLLGRFAVDRSLQLERQLHAAHVLVVAVVEAVLDGAALRFRFFHAVLNLFHHLVALFGRHLLSAAATAAELHDVRAAGARSAPRPRSCS